MFQKTRVFDYIKFTIIFGPMDRAQFREIRTRTWHTNDYIGMPSSKVRFAYVEREAPEPEEAFHVRKSVWKEKLEEKRQDLERANPKNRYLIRLDDETGQESLFEQGEHEKRKMWAGRTVTMADYSVTDEKADIMVYPISYTEWIACHEPEYSEAFEKKGIRIPYAGIGASVLIETRDGLIPLTRRGIETPVYPSMLYSPGGGPKPGEGSTEALLQEILEETGMEANKHFDPSQLHMMALVSDTQFAGSRHSRPELVARLPTDLSYRNIEDIQHAMVRKKNRKETDFLGLEPVSMNLSTLKQIIKLHGREMCPPTEAALTYEIYELRKNEIGHEKAFEELRDFVHGIKKYYRSKYEVPVLLLGD